MPSSRKEVKTAMITMSKRVTREKNGEGLRRRDGGMRTVGGAAKRTNVQRELP